MTESLWQSTTMRAFVDQVRDAAQLEYEEEAEQLARATLRTLAESISGGQVDELMQGLPQEIRDDLSDRSGQARSMDKGGFLDRVSGEISTNDVEVAERQTRAVLATLRRWSPAGEIDDTVNQLPSSIAALFR